MFQDVEQIATLDVKDDVLESAAALRPELRVLRVVPVEVLPAFRLAQCVLNRHTLASAPVPAGVPELGARTIKRQPTPTNEPIKNGPEIVNFRPVLESRATLANRRLQPLGHLTATEP
jgi:hypothetical protein